MFNNTTANISTFFENHAISPQKTLCHLDLTFWLKFKKCLLRKYINFVASLKNNPTIARNNRMLDRLKN